MSDYNFLMESRLSPEQFRVLNHISRLAAEQGLNLYLVGGAVRDLTYGQQTIRDLDFAVEGNPQRLIRALGVARNGRIRPSELRIAPSEPPPLQVEYLRFDSQLQSAEFTFISGVRGEIAMSRNEIYSKPGRRPIVVPSMIFEDLKRRDFSVNAMAVSLHPNSRGLLLDPTNGGADVEAHELRVMHSRSFAEDSSRIYRLLRLCYRLDFKPDPKTKQYLESALENGLWQRLNAEQQGSELRAILQEENPGRILKMLVARRLLAGLDRNAARARIPYECLTKIRSVIRLVPGAEPFLLNFHCLAERLGSAQKSRLAKLVILHPAAAKLAFGFDAEAQKLARALKSSRAGSPSQVYALLSTQPQPLLLFLLAHYRDAKVQKRVRNYLLKYPEIRAKLPRTELQALGVKPGPKFDKIIERVFRDQLDGKIKSHQQLMKALRAYAGIKEPPPKPAKPPARAAKQPAKPAVRIAKQPAEPAKPPAVAPRIKKQKK